MTEWRKTTVSFLEKTHFDCADALMFYMAGILVERGHYWIALIILMTFVLFWMIEKRTSSRQRSSPVT